MSVRGSKGFTLVEMMVAVTVSGLVLAALAVTFQTQSEDFVVQGQISTMQQNARAAMHYLQTEVRMAGYDPVLRGNGGFGITDVRFYNKDNALSAITDISDPLVGFSSLTFTGDFGDGAAPSGPPNSALDGNETITYVIYDFPLGSGGNGVFDLGRDVGGGRQLIAENIDAIGFAFAFDTDNDGVLDTYNDASGTQRIIWAIDSDNDNELDSNLDADNDGAITADDCPAPEGEGDNCAIAGVALVLPGGGATVDLGEIRAVRIWLLARGDRRDKGFYDTETYVVGRQVISPGNQADDLNNEVSQGGFRRLLLETTVYIREAG